MNECDRGCAQDFFDKWVGEREWFQDKGAFQTEYPRKRINIYDDESI